MSAKLIRHLDRPVLDNEMYRFNFPKILNKYRV